MVQSAKVGQDKHSNDLTSFHDGHDGHQTVVPTIANANGVPGVPVKNCCRLLRSLDDLRRQVGHDVLQDVTSVELVAVHHQLPLLREGLLAGPKIKKETEDGELCDCAENNENTRIVSEDTLASLVCYK